MAGSLAALLDRLLAEPSLRAGVLADRIAALVQAVRAPLAAAWCSVCLLDASGQRLRCLQRRGEDGDRGGQELLAANLRSWAEALRASRVLAISHAPLDPRSRELWGSTGPWLGASSILAAGIRRADGSLAGFIAWEHQGTPRNWTEAEEVFAAAIADHLALQVEAEAVAEALSQAASATADALQLRREHSLAEVSAKVLSRFNDLLTSMRARIEEVARAGSVGRVQEAARRLRRDAGRLGVSARLLAGYALVRDPAPEEVVLGEILDDLQDTLELMLPTQVTLQIDVAHDLPAVQVDRGHLELALVLLTTEALCQFDTEGELCVSCRHSVAAHQLLLELRPRQGGYRRRASLAEIDLEQGPEVQLIEGPGNAIGALREQGIRCERRRDRDGSCSWRIALPVVEAGGTGSGSRAEAETQVGVGAILVVEDDQDIRDLIANALQIQGRHVLAVANGARALELGGRNQLALLITDIGLPDIDGREVAARLRQLHPKLPVLVISGAPPDAGGLRLGEGRVRYLPKPFSMRRLIEEVRDILG